MEDSLKGWLLNPMISRLVAVVIGVLIVAALERFFQRSLSRYVKGSENRYRARKMVTILGYAGVMVIAIVYSSKLCGFTVALGVAGAGIAFALQEVIASIAGSIDQSCV